MLAPKTVLIIDDTVLLLRAIDMMFRLHFPNVKVTTSPSARESLTKIEGGARWDAILCDLSMPDMGGVDFVLALEHIDPDLASRCVMLTGGALNVRDQQFILTHPTIEKPFRPEDLRQVLGL